MTAKADKCVADLDMGLYGDVISEAMLEHKIHIAHDSVKKCTPEQIQAANPYILAQALYSRDTQLSFSIAEKVIDTTHYASELIHLLRYHSNDWMLKILYDCGMVMNPENIKTAVWLSCLFSALN